MGSFQNEPILNKSKCGLLGISLCYLEVSGANLKTKAICFSKILVSICQKNRENHDVNLHHLWTSISYRMTKVNGDNIKEHFQVIIKPVEDYDPVRGRSHLKY